jgi:DNA primase large subunit
MDRLAIVENLRAYAVERGGANYTVPSDPTWTPWNLPTLDRYSRCEVEFEGDGSTMTVYSHITDNSLPAEQRNTCTRCFHPLTRV